MYDLQQKFINLNRENGWIINMKEKEDINSRMIQFMKENGMRIRTHDHGWNY
jgi:hypothetical protein